MAQEAFSPGHQSTAGTVNGHITVFQFLTDPQIIRNDGQVLPFRNVPTDSAHGR